MECPEVITGFVGRKGRRYVRILFLSQRFLLPMDTGGKIRSGKLLQKLSRMHDVTLISNVESPKDDSYLSEIESLCQHFVAVPWRELKRHSLWFYVRLFTQLFSKNPVSVLNDYSRNLQTAVRPGAAPRPPPGS